MRLIINGIENGSNTIIRGADYLMHIFLCEDLGDPVDLTAPAVVTLEFYPSLSRDQSPTLSLSGTIAGGATAGYCTVTVEDTTTVPRGQYYLSAVWKSNAGTGPGTLVKISSGFDSLLVA